MKEEEKKIVLAFKRLIHVLTTGKRTPRKYGNSILHRAEVHILEIIGESPGISASDIVDDLEITKGAVSQIVIKLAKKKLVRKVPNANNAKVHELHPTEEGMEALFWHEEHEKALMNKVLPELRKCSPKDIQRFTEIVNMVADFVDQ